MRNKGNIAEICYQIIKPLCACLINCHHKRNIVSETWLTVKKQSTWSSYHWKLSCSLNQIAMYALKKTKKAVAGISVARLYCGCPWWIHVGEL